MDRELAERQFKDVRLLQRFRKLLGQIASAVGWTIPFVCQDRANTKAAYRLFSNERVDEEAILSGHFQVTRDRVARRPAVTLRFRRQCGWVIVLSNERQLARSDSATLEDAKREAEAGPKP